MRKRKNRSKTRTNSNSRGSGISKERKDTKQFGNKRG